MIDVVFSAFAQAAPDRVVANAYGTINALSIALLCASAVGPLKHASACVRVYGDESFCCYTRFLVAT